MANNRIHTRGLTSFFTLFGFIIMSITGLVLYIVPAGRVAYWTNWELMGWTKTDWDNIHILSSLLFIVAGIFHTYLNWKPLMNYFRDKVTHSVKLRKELVISSVISLWVVISSLYAIPPLGYLLDFNAYIKTVWITHDDYEPPFGHAELLTLKVFAKKMDIDLARAVRELKDKGIKFTNTEETLEEIAKNNNTSPMNIYLLIKQFEPKPDTSQAKQFTPESVELEFSGTGIGNKTINALCERIGVDTTTALQRLQQTGINAAGDQTLKSVGEAYDFNPIEILKVMLIEGYQPDTTLH